MGKRTAVTLSDGLLAVVRSWSGATERAGGSSRSRSRSRRDTARDRCRIARTPCSPPGRCTACRRRAAVGGHRRLADADLAAPAGDHALGDLRAAAGTWPDRRSRRPCRSAPAGSASSRRGPRSSRSSRSRSAPACGSCRCTWPTATPRANTRSCATARRPRRTGSSALVVCGSHLSCQRQPSLPMPELPSKKQSCLQGSMLSPGMPVAYELSSLSSGPTHSGSCVVDLAVAVVVDAVAALGLCRSGSCRRRRRPPPLVPPPARAAAVVRQRVDGVAQQPGTSRGRPRPRAKGQPAPRWRSTSTRVFM